MSNSNLSNPSVVQSFVPFLCQSCQNPTKMDPSLLDKSNLEVLMGMNSFACVLTRYVESMGQGNGQVEEALEEVKNDQFVVLSKEKESNGKPPEPPRTSLSHRLKVASRLFDVMSEKTKVDHPLCQDCCDALQKKMEQRLAELEEEVENHQKFKQQLEQTSKSDKTKLEQEIKHLKITEEQNIAVLKTLATKKKTLQDEYDALEAEAKELDVLEASLWTDWDNLQEQIREYELEKESINLKIEHATSWLERLQKSNVYNDAFKISHDGQFGTINGFRLGRLPNHPVDWTEINAALGQTMLLLYTLAKKLNYKFANYKLIPNGSFSRIEKIDGDKTVLEFYGSDSLSINRLFQNRRFDQALVAFLNCLQQLGDVVEKSDASFKVPYNVVKDKIGDTSIKPAFQQDEAWTRSLKFSLINLKWIMAWVASH